MKGIQCVLDLPELKIIKPSDIHWLSHEQCVKVPKENYSAIVTALDKIYEETYEPEALGISKVLRKSQQFHLYFYLITLYVKLPSLARHYKQYKWT